MSERIPVIGAIRELFQTREGLIAEAEQRQQALEAIGGLDAVNHMPLHEIEEALGYAEFPVVDRGGNTYPSLAELRRESDRHDESLTRRVGELPREQTLFARIQGHFVEKARRERDK